MRIIRFIKHLIRCIMSEYPYLNFHFQVEWGGTRLGFTEVSGLEIEHEIVEYREGASPVSSSKKMPGIRKYSNITLKRGIVKGDNEFFEWINTISMNQVERRDVIIKLLDGRHDPVRVWRIRNAWPVKFSGTDLKADSGEVAIESLELAHEGMTVETE